MRFKDAAKILPACFIKTAVVSQTGGGGIRHIERMMGIVMREQTLPAKCDQSLDLTHGVIELLKIGFVPLGVDRIRVAKPPRHDLANRRADGDARLL